MALRIERKKPSELSYWQSYSDMMAALLLVFVLIIVFAITMMKSTYEEKQAELEARNREIEQYQEQLHEQEEIMHEQQRQIDSIIGVRGNIIEKLKNEFSGSEVGISVDPDTGAISFNSSVLFDFGKSNLKSSGREFLTEFFPRYFDIILSEDIHEYVAEVIIEGHTDNVGSYLSNLDLSQKRAYSVAQFCLEDNNVMFTPELLEQVRELVTANGRSFYELKYDASGKVDAEASRRVEIKFRLKEDDMIREMSKILEE